MFGQRYQIFLWMFDEIFRENAKNRHFLTQNVQTDNDFGNFVWNWKLAILVLPDCSVTRHEHFLLNNGDFWLFLKIFAKKEMFLSGKAVRTRCLNDACPQQS